MSKRRERVRGLEARVQPASPVIRAPVPGRPGVFVTTEAESAPLDCFACQTYAGAVIAPDGVARVLTSMAGISRVVQPCKVHP